MKKGFTTKALHTPFPKKDAYNALHMPVYDGAAFEFDSAQDIADSFEGKKFAHAYSRTSNPTVEYFEHKMKAISGAYGVVALSSGMAAISNLILTLTEKGDNIISSNHLFGHTYALFHQTLASMGIEVRFADMGNPEEVEAKMDLNTRAVFFETITNPQLEIIDIEKLSALAHRKGVVIVSDSTLTPPYVFDSKKHGVDISVMSSTKFISGGATSVGGVILDNGTFDWSQIPVLQKWAERFGKDALIARIRKEIFRHLGGCMTAHTAHFQLLGLDILALRVDRCVDNCLKLGKFLQNHPKVTTVNYPGLKSNEGFTLSKKQFSGKPGAIMTFELESREACFNLYDQLQLIRRATNLNDNKTLIIHPHSTIYAEFSEEERKEMGIRSTLMRMSVGIEDAEDLIEDLKQALDKL